MLGNSIEDRLTDKVTECIEEKLNELDLEGIISDSVESILTLESTLTEYIESTVDSIDVDEKMREWLGSQ